jgi:putative transcriptional regulator
MTNIHERIRELRKAERLSQAELGERVGIGRVGITKLEQGQRPISVEEAYALAQALSVSILELLGETQVEESHPDEGGLELRFEVTVKLLPSREEKQEMSPGLQRVNEQMSEIIRRGAEKQGRTRVTGKDAKVKSKGRTKA